MHSPPSPSPNCVTKRGGPAHSSSSLGTLTQIFVCPYSIHASTYSGCRLTAWNVWRWEFPHNKGQPHHTRIKGARRLSCTHLLVGAQASVTTLGSNLALVHFQTHIDHHHLNDIEKRGSGGSEH